MQVLSQQLEDARRTHERLSGTIADRNARISELESDGDADGGSDAAQPGFLLDCRPDDCDDLQRIRGIGTALEKALNELGIYRLRQIAALKDADIKWLDGSLKGFKGRIVRDAWVEQADELSFGG
jgi:predicted flap endonuclease-1-like 5' DNA nuclease